MPRTVFVGPGEGSSADFTAANLAEAVEEILAAS
jgi:hypothetical protein